MDDFPAEPNFKKVNSRCFINHARDNAITINNNIMKKINLKNYFMNVMN